MSSPTQDCCPALSAVEFLSRFDSGVRVLDVRAAPDWATSHLCGSIFIGHGQLFGRWAQALLNPELPLLLVTDPGQQAAPIQSLLELGHSSLQGLVEGGFAALQEFPARLTRTERVDHNDLAAELEGAHPPQLFDVRQPPEWQAGHIEQAIHLPLTEIEERRAELPSSGRVILHCGGGYRSLIAVSLLEAHGQRGLLDLEGGYGAWTKNGRPTTQAQ